jgi:quercetin dioxygenase-like cupin family protein
MKVASYNEEQIFDDNKVKTSLILETPFSKEIRILMKKGQIMKEHQTQHPIAIHVLSGKINLGIEGDLHEIGDNQIISLFANTPHDLSALEDSVIRLTISNQDKVERVEEILNN